MCKQEVQQAGSDGTYDTEDDSEGKIPHESSGEAEETLMVYMVGSNLESQMGAATQDMQEMALSGYDPEKMNIVVCAGGAKKWWNSSVKKKELSAYIMQDEDIVPFYEMEGTNMSEPETLTEFINAAKDSYPAEKYSLILWNHGGGVVVGYGADENYGNEMLSVNQLSSAIEDSDVCKEGKFEWIGFDACMMGMVEVADALKYDAEYMIASEEVEAQDGWNYKALGDLTDKDAYDGDEAGKIITEAFGDYYEENYRFTPDYTLACIDMSKVDKVTEAIEDFAKKADIEVVGSGYSKIARARDNSKSFGATGSTSLYDYIDLTSFSRQIESIYPDEAKDLETAVDDCVIHNVTNIGRASGLSVYFPFESTDLMDQMVEKYDEEKFNDEYSSFIHDFTSRLNGEELTDWNISRRSPISDATGESAYSVQLTEEEIENFSKATSSVWEKNSDDENGESYVLILNSSNTQLDENGNLSTDFDGRVFYITDDSGERVPVYAIQTEQTDDYSEYITYVMKGDLGSEDLKKLWIHIRVSDEYPKGIISGIYNQVSGDSIEAPDKNLETIEEGDHLTFMSFTRNIKFDGNGSVEPFENWETESFWGVSMDVKGELKVIYEKPELEHDYIGLFNIHDTQGRTHYTDYIDIHVDGKAGNGESVYDEAAATYENEE